MLFLVFATVHFWKAFANLPSGAWIPDEMGLNCKPGESLMSSHGNMTHWPLSVIVTILSHKQFWHLHADLCGPRKATVWIIGSSMGSTRLQSDIPKLITFYRNGRLKLDELVTGKYPFDKINDAIDSTERGEAFYENFSEMLDWGEQPIVIFSIADCLKPFLSRRFNVFYDDGHLTCFRSE